MSAISQLDLLLQKIRQIGTGIEKEEAKYCQEELATIRGNLEILAKENVKLRARVVSADEAEGTAADRLEMVSEQLRGLRSKVRDIDILAMGIDRQMTALADVVDEYRKEGKQ